MGIVIHYAPQTRAVIALWAIEELDIPYERVKLDYKEGEHKSEAFTKINPNQRVPAMVIDGKPMFESTAMVIFLGEKYGAAKKLWPSDDAGRAQAMGWSVWGMVQLGQDIHSLMIASSPRVPNEMHNEAQAKAARAATDKDLQVLDDHLAKQPYIMGDAFSLADVLPATAMFFATVGGIDTSKYTHVGAWMQRIGTREPLKRAQSA